MKEFLRQTGAIAAKDLRVELRSREVINAAGAFSIVVLLLFSFAFDPITNPDLRATAGGLLWVVYAFAGILVLNRGFARETANDCLSAIVAAPVSGGALFMGKAIANATLLIALELLSLPIFAIFYDVRWLPKAPELLLVLVLGGWALTVVGTMFGAVTANNRLRELMLPLLVFPFVLPALIACVQLTATLLAGEPWSDSTPWLKLLFGFDLIFSLLGAALLEYVVRA